MAGEYKALYQQSCDSGFTCLSGDARWSVFLELLNQIKDNPSSGGGPSFLPLAVSDELLDLTTGLAKLTFRSYINATITGIRASVTGAPTGSNIEVNINKNGVSITGPVLTILATAEEDDETAVITDTAIAVGDEFTIDIDAIGSVEPGIGLKVWINLS